MSGRLLPHLLLCLLVGAVFGQTLGFDFVSLDDSEYVTKNGRVFSGVTLENIHWAWTVPYASNWHPLTWMSLMLDAQLFGLWAGGFHLTGVVLHGLSACLLFSLLARTTGVAGKSLFVAACFAVHPLRAESVAWISERKDTLSTFLVLLAIDGYVRYVRSEEHRRFWYVVSAVCFACSLMSKQMYVTLPALLLVLDVWPLGRLSGQPDSAVADPPTRARLLIEKLPYLVLSLLSAWIVYRVQESSGAVQPAVEFPLQLRILNAVNSYADYIVMTVWPQGLSCYYPFPDSSEIFRRLPISVMLLGGLTGVCVGFRRRAPALLAGWLWYLGTLFPVAGIVQIMFHRMCDRYTYFPSIGLGILAAWGVSAVWERFVPGAVDKQGEAVPQQPGVMSKAGLRLPACAVVLLLACLGQRQTACWKNSETLYEQSVRANPGNYLAHSYLGVELFEQGRIELARKHLEESLRLEPPYDSRVRGNYSVLLRHAGDLAGEVELWRGAVERDPSSADARLKLAQAYLLQRRTREATEELQAALKRDPKHFAALHELGNLSMAAGEYGAAERYYLASLQSHPWVPTLHNNLGNLARMTNDVRQAIGHYRRAVFIEPTLSTAQNNLASALAEAGELEAAVAQYRTSLSFSPENAVTHARLGRLLLQMGRREAAVEQLGAALRIDPRNREALQLRSQLGIE